MQGIREFKGIFGEIRTIVEGNKIYFVGKDIANALGYARPTKAIQDNCRGILKKDIPTNGGVQEMIVITEGDVYRLIVKSQLPKAQDFERWLFDIVVPQIRQTGGYMPVRQNDSDEVIMAKALEIMHRTLGQKDTIIESQQRILEEQKPKVEYYEQIVERGHNTSITNAGRLIGLSKTRIFKLLIDKKWIFKEKKKNADWLPYQRIIDKGYMVVKEVLTPNGQITKQALVTVKGREKLLEIKNKEDL